MVIANYYVTFRLKQEDEAWTEVGNSYNAFRAQVLADVNERKKELPSAKAKGKQRVTEADVELWGINEDDLPEHLRGKDGLGLARSILDRERRQSVITNRVTDLEYTVSPSPVRCQLPC